MAKATDCECDTCVFLRQFVGWTADDLRFIAKNEVAARDGLDQIITNMESDRRDGWKTILDSMEKFGIKPPPAVQSRSPGAP